MKKKKSNNMVVEISDKMKNTNWLSMEKNYRMRKSTLL